MYRRCRYILYASCDSRCPKRMIADPSFDFRQDRPPADHSINVRLGEGIAPPPTRRGRVAKTFLTRRLRARVVTRSRGLSTRETATLRGTRPAEWQIG